MVIAGRFCTTLATRPAAAAVTATGATIPSMDWTPQENRSPTPARPARWLSPDWLRPTRTISEKRSSIVGAVTTIARIPPSSTAADVRSVERAIWPLSRASLRRFGVGFSVRLSAT